MRFDMQALFSDAQALSGTSATSTNAIDINAAGFSEAPCFVAVRFDTATHGCTAVELQGSSEKSGTYVALAKMGVTDTTEGAGVNLAVPQGCPQYLKVVYTGASMKGNVTAGVTLCAPSPRGKRIGDYKAEAH